MFNGHVIVRYSKPSHWKSCNIIEEVLARKFSEALPWIQENKEMLPAGTDRLIISDHRWLAPDKLSTLAGLPSLKIDFYLYGDFTLRLKDFSAHMSAFKKHKVSLIVASESQKRLVTQIFPEYETLLSIHPYPLDENLFLYDEKARKAFREKHQLGDGKIFGFPGRISRQKGVIELMTTFLKNEITGTLVLLGPVHSHPFWQYDEAEDKNFMPEFQRLLSIGGEKIKRITEISYEEMPSFYSAIDIYVSVSYFHDEDFNLTLDEALAAGKPAIVTAWGGHLRHKDNPRVTFVGMDLTGETVKPDTEKLKEALTGTLQKKSPERMKLLPLTSEERSFVRENEHFLKNGNSFNRELYLKIYSSYL